jgi:hypothetical protein
MAGDGARDGAFAGLTGSARGLADQRQISPLLDIIYPAATCGRTRPTGAVSGTVSGSGGVIGARMGKW